MAHTDTWRVTEGRNPDWPHIITADGLHGLDPLTGENIVAVVNHGHRQHANVIATSPDLLAALKDMLAGWRYIREHYGDLYGVGWDRCEDAARAAIIRAEGR